MASRNTNQPPGGYGQSSLAKASPLARGSQPKGISLANDPSLVADPAGPITREQKEFDPNFATFRRGQRARKEIFVPLPGCSTVTVLSSMNDKHFAKQGGLL